MRCRIIVAAENSADLLAVVGLHTQGIAIDAPSFTDLDFDDAVRLALRGLIQESAA
jgi:hypothetical protein